MAGTSAAAYLADNHPHLSVTLFDMGTRLGGRCAPLLIPHPHPPTPTNNNTFLFDRGAQFIVEYTQPASSEAFKRQIQEWKEAQVLEEWKPTVEKISSHYRSRTTMGTKIYVGVPSMTSPVEFLASKLLRQPSSSSSTSKSSTIQQGFKVVHAAYDVTNASWTVQSVPSRSSTTATTTITTRHRAMIVADALPLIDSSAGHIDVQCNGNKEIEKKLESIRVQVRHQPVFTVMMAIEKNTSTTTSSSDNDTKDVADVVIYPLQSGDDDDKNKQARKSSSFQILVRNSSKPGRQYIQTTPTIKIETWVGITTPERSNALLEKFPLYSPTTGAYMAQTRGYRESVANELKMELLTALLDAKDAASGPASPGERELNRNEKEKELNVVFCQVQRWGKGFVAVPAASGGSHGAEDGCWWGVKDAGFALCGDYFRGTSTSGSNGLEVAWESGKRAGEAVAGWLG